MLLVGQKIKEKINGMGEKIANLYRRGVVQSTNSYIAMMSYNIPFATRISVE
jgi:hypothetical protein